jgi:hypothetical protein
MLTASPPRLDDMPNRSIVGLVRYLRQCTAPADRVLVTWFAPDIYFYSQRAFAARIVALFGSHWSEPRFEERSIEALASQRVPLVVTRTGDERFGEEHRLLKRYLDEHYKFAGTSDFGDPEIGSNGYTVLARRDLPPKRTYADTAMPCFW